MCDNESRSYEEVHRIPEFIYKKKPVFKLQSPTNYSAFNSIMHLSIHFFTTKKSFEHSAQGVLFFIHRTSQ